MERLDKLIAHHAGISRQDAQKAIRRGTVTVDGAVVRDPGGKVDPAAALTLAGQPLTVQQHLYIMMNKPAGLLCVSRDPNAPTVMDGLPPAWKKRGLFPAGRLDKDTVGFVLLTDDGDFAHRMLAPKKHVAKTYLVRSDAPVDAAMVAAFAAGVTLGDGTLCRPAVLEPLQNDQNPLARVVITEGRYHQIKRMFGAFGRKVLWLKRTAIGGLMLDETLPEGAFRELSEAEKQAVFGNG